MPTLFSSSFTQRSSTWTIWKAARSLRVGAFGNHQYESVDGGYRIWFYDGQELYTCTIWQGIVPDDIIIGGYSQVQNDADRADFETNYLPSANRALTEAFARPIPSDLHVTATAVANTGVTLTLPAAGAGLYHYITNIHIARISTAALLGTAALVITSTNLPGSPAWTVGNEMIAGDTQVDLDYAPTSPLKSDIANTATTLVMPAPGFGVLWRANCMYYVGA